MFLLIFNILVITVHVLSAYFRIPLALSDRNISNLWTTYLYGNFVHASTWHLVEDLLAFNLIYVLFPVVKPWFNLSFGWKMISLMLIMNLIINIFEMSSYNAYRPSVFHGISGTTYVLYFICSMFWMNHNKIIGWLMIAGGIASLFATPWINQYFSLDIGVNRIAREAHAFGALIAIYGYLIITRLFKQGT